MKKKLPQYSFGSWMDKNAGTIIKDAMMLTGAGLGFIPGLSALAPVINASANALGSTVGGALNQSYANKQGEKQTAEMQKLMQQQMIAQAGNQQIQPQPTYMQPMRNGGKLYPNGGTLVNYTGQTHEGKDGGIEVDKQGNPTVTTGQPPVGLVENNEISYKTKDGQVFVFSDQLGYAKQAKRVMNKYKNAENDSIQKRGMDKELGRLAEEQERYKSFIQQSQPEENNEQDNEEDMEQYRKGGDLSKAKAKEILHDKTAHGHPLTDKQRKYMAWVAYSKKMFGGDLPKMADGGNAPTPVGGAYDYTDDQLKLQQAYLNKLSPEQQSEAQKIMGLPLTDPTRQKMAADFMGKNKTYMTEDEQRQVIGEERYKQYRPYVNQLAQQRGVDLSGTEANSFNLWGGRHMFDFGIQPKPAGAVDYAPQKTYVSQAGSQFENVPVNIYMGGAATGTPYRTFKTQSEYNTFAENVRGGKEPNWSFSGSDLQYMPVKERPQVVPTTTTLKAVGGYLYPQFNCGGKMADGGPMHESQHSTQGGADTKSDQYTGAYNYMIPLAQVAGDAAMLALQKKMQMRGVGAPPITPRYVNYGAQRAQIQSNLGATQRANQMSMRNANLNPVQMMSAVGAGNVGAMRGANEAMMSSGMAEQQANAGIANQFAGMNAQRKMQADMYNAQMRNYSNMQRLGLYQDIASTPAKAMRDIQSIQQYEKQAQKESPYYDYTKNPNDTFFQKFMGKNAPVKKVSQYGKNMTLAQKADAYDEMMKSKRFGGYLKRK